jgi:hypothetical protein
MRIIFFIIRRKDMDFSNKKQITRDIFIRMRKNNFIYRNYKSKYRNFLRRIQKIAIIDFQSIIDPYISVPTHTSAQPTPATNLTA